MLNEQVASKVIDIYDRVLDTGKLPTKVDLEQYYQNFREKFGPERLRNLDGEDLLVLMHDRGTESLVYWLEFKNDEEFPSIFGSIAGGSALKFGIFLRKETNEWNVADSSNYPRPIPVDKALEVVRQQRDQLIAGCEVIAQLTEDASEDDYLEMQEQLGNVAPDVYDLAWGHKYFSLIYPEYLDDYHNPQYQRYHLVKLLQVPPATDGRYVCAWRFRQIGQQLNMPLNHLTSVLNVRDGNPKAYWRVETNSEETGANVWPQMQQDNFIGISWREVGDLSTYQNTRDEKEKLKQVFESGYGDKVQSVAGKVNEIVRFVAKMDAEDIILAIHNEKVIGIGEVVGDYYYVPNGEMPHRRPVKWLSFDEWQLPSPFGTGWSVYKAPAYDENIVETEQRLLTAQPLTQQPLVIPSQTKSRIVALEGIPGQIQQILDRKGQVIIYGPPGTGKTYWAETTACELSALNVFGKKFNELTAEQKSEIIGSSPDATVRIATFHPAYGYEDFIEGYRPVIKDDMLSYKLQHGVFRQICEDAFANPSRNYYLLIDEINRGDIPRIFGELLTLLEKDKRNKHVILPLSTDSFAVPDNVYVIGTMNTADRSIALLDAALRRRFGFIEMMPDVELLADSVIEGIPLNLWLNALNRQVLSHIGHDARNLQIGHAYLLEDSQPIKTFSKFVAVLRNDIIPLLQEYCYEDYQTLERILGSAIVDLPQQRINVDLFDNKNKDNLVQALVSLDPEIATSRQALQSDREDTEDTEDIEE